LHQASIALQVNSVPLSETIEPGLPRRASIAVSSRATRRPEIDVSDRAQTLLGDVVDDVEDAEASAIGELVIDEVERPARVRPRFQKDRHPDANRLAAGASLAHG
jgi:hypothetical protein